MTKIIHSESGKRAVVISSNEDGGPFRANLYVNCNPDHRDANGLGDITLTKKKAQKLSTVETWAKGVL